MYKQRISRLCSWGAILKKIKTLSSVAVFALSVAAMANPAAASFAQTSSQSSVTQSDASTTHQAGWYVDFPATGHRFTPQDDVDSSQGPNPRLLDLTDWTNCHVFQNETHVIDSFDFYWNGESKDMGIQCGKAENPGGQGYFHIVFGHEDQWRGRIDQIGIGASTDPWDDLMWVAAVESLLGTWDSSGGGPDGKLCAASKMEMKKTDGTLVYTFYPSFSWSLTNNRLITAIPTTSSNC